MPKIIGPPARQLMDGITDCRTDLGGLKHQKKKRNMSYLRNEIEARDADKLETATDYAASTIANRHGSGEVAAKIQAYVIVVVV